MRSEGLTASGCLPTRPVYKWVASSPLEPKMPPHSKDEIGVHHSPTAPENALCPQIFGGCAEAAYRGQDES